MILSHISTLEMGLSFLAKELKHAATFEPLIPVDLKPSIDKREVILV